MFRNSSATWREFQNLGWLIKAKVRIGITSLSRNDSSRYRVRDNSVPDLNFTPQRRRSMFIIYRSEECSWLFHSFSFKVSRVCSSFRRMQYSLTFTYLPSVREFYGLISGECKVIITPVVPFEQPGPLIACALEDVKRQLRDEIFILYPEERERVLSNAILQVGHQGRKPDLSPFRWVCDDNNNCFVNIEEADFSEPFFCSYFSHSL